MMGAKNTQGDLLLDFVMGTMFLVLPTFWIALLSITGLKVGSLMDGLSNGTRTAQNAGAEGGKQTMNAGAQVMSAGRSSTKP